MEDNDSLDFDDVLEKARVLVKRSKCLADFIQDRENDLIDKYTGLEEKRPNALIYPAQDLILPTQVHTMQKPVQEDIPVVRVLASQIVEVKAGEVRSGVNDCILISDPAKNFYEDLGTLFTNLKPGIEKIRQLHIDCVTISKSLDNTIGLEKYTFKLDSNSKRNL